MICPFCQKPLEGAGTQCPHCSKPIKFTAELHKLAEELRRKGETAEAHKDFRSAMNAYRSLLRFVDSDEVKSRIRLLEARVNQRYIRLCVLVVLGLLTVLAGVIIVVGLSFIPAKTVINSVTVNTIEPSRRAAHVAREAYTRQDWTLAMKVLNKLALDPDWGWVARDRFDEVKNHYVAMKVNEALALKKAGDSAACRRILLSLSRQKQDDSRETVFRLRRAEGLALFEALDRQSPRQQSVTLEEIVALFRPDELPRIYYADDCLYRLAVIKASAGDEDAARNYFKLIKDRCPQGKWYWPAADAYLAEH